MQSFRFDLIDLPPAAEALRLEVRAFLAEQLADRSAEARAQTWTGHDAAFSRAVGARGWIGMTWPRAYGGHERSALERFVVLEEMLAAGAPVAAHWIGDRQSGPLLLKFGTETQRQAILPRIAAGECFFCIGMSEPDSGSDLASVRSRAERVEGGWRLNGRKLWTSGAQHCHLMIGLFRSGGTEEGRHKGLSQFLIDLTSPGIQIRPIRNLAGEEHFNEILFEDVFVPADMLVGTEGEGWSQVTAELAYERSGPERYLSSFRLVVELARNFETHLDDRAAEVLGRLVAHLHTQRQMTIALAGMLEAGQNPALEASVSKDVGNILEQEIPGIAQGLLDEEPSLDGGSDYQRVLAYLTQVSPSFSLRGGTREIMRGMIARGLGLR